MDTEREQVWPMWTTGKSDRYMAVAGNNNVNISVESEKITIVFFLK